MRCIECITSIDLKSRAISVFFDLSGTGFSTTLGIADPYVLSLMPTTQILNTVLIFPCP